MSDPSTQRYAVASMEGSELSTASLRPDWRSCEGSSEWTEPRGRERHRWAKPRGRNRRERMSQCGQRASFNWATPKAFARNVRLKGFRRLSPPTSEFWPLTRDLSPTC